MGSKKKNTNSGKYFGTLTCFSGKQMVIQNSIGKARLLRRSAADADYTMPTVAGVAIKFYIQLLLQTVATGADDRNPLRCRCRRLLRRRWLAGDDDDDHTLLISNFCSRHHCHRSVAGRCKQDTHLMILQQQQTLANCLSQEEKEKEKKNSKRGNK